MIEAESFDQVKGLCVYTLVSEEYRTAFEKMTQDVLQGNVRTLEVKMIGLHGRPLWLYTHAVPMRDEKGTIISVLAITTDITERKKVEEKLRRSEEHLSLIFNSTSDMLALVRVESNDRFVIQAVNHSYLSSITSEFPGISVEGIIGRERREFIKAITSTTSSAADKEEAVYRAVTNTRTEVSYEVSVPSPRGSMVLEIRLTPILDQGGKCTHILWSARNVTERKRAEEALRESERSLKTLMGNLPGMAYRCRKDPNRTMEYVSEGAVGLTGYRPEDLIGNARIAYRDLVHPDDQDPVWEAVQAAVGMKEKYTLQYRIRRADGQERLVWEQGQGVFSGAGGLLALEGFIIDSTERRLLEEERLKIQKLESIGTLAGGIAHDFNNLLQGIFGYISLARMTVDRKEESLAMLEQAEKALHQSVNLTAQLLTFSKGGKPVKHAIALGPVIENAVKFALSGSKTDHRIVLREQLLPVEVDEGQIAQVIQNIVLNADQAMPLGGTVMITAGNVHAPGPEAPARLAAGDYVMVSVQDTGVGVPEQYLSKIFDPYFTTKEKGSGLGLATSYSIVRNHDGLIDARSEAGKGSVFTVFLPAAEGGAPSAVPVMPASLVTRTGRVLVMDDEEVVRKVAGELIRLLGHEVEFAGDGKAAIAKYLDAKEAGKPFDVVILDLTVRGGMGGAETMEALRAVDPEVKAVVSSGYADSEVLSAHQSYGFRAMLKKPYKLDNLNKTLNALLT